MKRIGLNRFELIIGLDELTMKNNLDRIILKDREINEFIYIGLDSVKIIANRIRNNVQPNIHKKIIG